MPKLTPIPVFNWQAFTIDLNPVTKGTKIYLSDIQNRVLYLNKNYNLLHLSSCYFGAVTSEGYSKKDLNCDANNSVVRIIVEQTGERKYITCIKLELYTIKGLDEKLITTSEIMRSTCKKTVYDSLGMIMKLSSTIY